jgi:hypothetical protein
MYLDAMVFRAQLSIINNFPIIIFVTIDRLYHIFL